MIQVIPDVHALVTFSRAEMDIVVEAARDAHLNPPEYMRLMVLAAAGMGGVTEHLERAIEASWKAEVLEQDMRPKRRKPVRGNRKRKASRS